MIENLPAGVDWVQLATLVGSLIAVLALGGLARGMGLGGDIRIVDDGHAIRLARDGLYGFEAVDVARDRAGYAALVKDAASHHALIVKTGAHFVVRMLRPPVEGRLDHALLTIDPMEPDFPPVTLNLGEKAQYWAAGLRHMPDA